MKELDKEELLGRNGKSTHFLFEDFGVEGFDIMGIFIGGSEELGEFSLQIDNVCLK